MEARLDEAVALSFRKAILREETLWPAHSADFELMEMLNPFYGRFFGSNYGLPDDLRMIHTSAVFPLCQLARPQVSTSNCLPFSFSSA
jgi:hypothetical protein